MAMRVDSKGGKNTKAGMKKDERQEAIRNGANTYQSTMPCRAAGHLGLRRTSTGKCILCEIERNNKDRKRRNEFSPIPALSLSASILNHHINLTPKAKS
ncbi:hypothetical protein fHeYen801_053c [Yersinia phage fHe-Yen8-01]|nr:hypothetical protein fHeYen801_053c [Yersinia phage fHe-Yen8-01]